MAVLGKQLIGFLSLGCYARNMATVVDRFESLLTRVRVHDVTEQSERTFEDERHDEIYRLLLESRGRLRQHEIVAQTEMSPSTISEQLAAMEDNGDIAQVKLSRGQIVCLPELIPDRQL